jgi:hypothetical protein
MARARISAAQKRHIAERASGCCEYCQSQAAFAPQSFSIEHIVPDQTSGTGNLAYACQGCNNHKYNKTHATDPLTQETIALFHPRKDRWSDHFAWSADYSLIYGLTPCGRATVAALQLNRVGVVNLRQALLRIGRHPPTTTALS